MSAPRVFGVEAQPCGMVGHYSHWSWDFGPLSASLEQDPDGTWSWNCGDGGCAGEATEQEALAAIERELLAISEAIQAAVKAAKGDE